MLVVVALIKSQFEVHEGLASEQNMQANFLCNDEVSKVGYIS